MSISPTEAYRKGELANPYAAQAIEHKREVKTLHGAEIVVYKGYELADVKDAGTRKLATPEQVQQLIDFAIRYGLDPYRGHVCLMYGRPFVEIDGLYCLAHNTGEMDGCNSRPLTISERDDYSLPPLQSAWIAFVWRKGCSHPFTGMHSVSQEFLDERSNDGKEYRNPTWRKWPGRMCEKQAQRFAFRMAFPDLPIWAEEAGDTEDQQQKGVKVEPETC
ncbi:MAG: recombinase RecT [Dehalococcoidia bacterium]|nr:recombinase RecT [Dehalococcoidia bacterium]